MNKFKESRETTNILLKVFLVACLLVSCNSISSVRAEEIEETDQDEYEDEIIS